MVCTFVSRFSFYVTLFFSDYAKQNSQKGVLKIQKKKKEFKKSLLGFYHLDITIVGVFLVMRVGGG